MARVEHNGGRNPLLIVSSEEVTAWLRSLADAHGLADRESCAVQLAVRDLPGGQEDVILLAAPELVFMVSNVPNSRQP